MICAGIFDSLPPFSEKSDTKNVAAMIPHIFVVIPL